MVDPFGGIQGRKFENISGFLIDKEESLKELQESIDILENKKIVKLSFLEQLRSKNNLTEQINNNVWEFIPNTNNEYVNIHLRWNKNNIRSINGIPIKSLKVALMGLKAFFNQINHKNPNLNHPDIMACYKISLLNYKELPPIEETNSLEENEQHLDPFAGVRGIDIYKKFNDIKKDKDIALLDVEYSLEFIDQLELPKSRRDKKFKTNQTKCIEFTFPTSENYLNLFLVWADIKIISRKNIELGRARLALASLSKFIKDIDVETPNLKDPLINQLYEMTKEKYKPIKGTNIHQELKPNSEGGLSYWSEKTHRWIIGKYDKKGKKFIPPKPNL